MGKAHIGCNWLAGLPAATADLMPGGKTCVTSAPTCRTGGLWWRQSCRVQDGQTFAGRKCVTGASSLSIKSRVQTVVSTVPRGGPDEECPPLCNQWVLRQTGRVVTVRSQAAFCGCRTGRPLTQHALRHLCRIIGLCTSTACHGLHARPACWPEHS